MNRSSKYNFYLPQNSDPISVSDFNYNFQLIDDNLITASQTWSSTQKSTARTNLGLGAAATCAVVNGLGETSSGSVLDARQGKVLDDKIAKRALTTYSISANSSVTISLDTGSRYLIITHSTATTVKEIMLVSCATNGTVGAVRVTNASNIAIDTSSNNAIAITNNASNAAQVYVERLQ